MTFKTKNVKMITLFYGIAFAAIAIIYLLIPFTHSGTFWSAYAFALVSIIFGGVLTCWAFGKNDNLESKFYSFPIFKLGIIYASLQNIISLIILILNVWVDVPSWIPSVISILLLAFAGMGSIAKEEAKEIIEEVHQKTEIKVKQVEYFNLDINDIANMCSNDEIKENLKPLIDKIKYCDPISIDATKEKEQEIECEIEKLRDFVEKSDVVSAKSQIDVISRLLDTRSKISQMSK